MRVVDDFFYHMFRLMNEANSKYIKNEEKKTATSLYSPLIWLLDKENDLPSWYTLNNARLRNLPIPKPDHDIRRCITESIAPKVYGYDSASDEQKRENTQLFISQTAGLYASELVAIVQLSRREGLKWGDIGEAIRRYKLGIMEYAAQSLSSPKT